MLLSCNIEHNRLATVRVARGFFLSQTADAIFQRIEFDAAHPLTSTVDDIIPNGI